MYTLEPFIFLYITEKCQLRCKHCYVGERLNRQLEMTPEQVRTILTQLRVTHGHYKVYLLGGEPFLHPQLAEIIKICKELGYSVVLTSNGLFDTDLLNKIPLDLIDSLSFSFDGGIPESHEKIRGRKTFEPLLRNAKAAVERGLQTRFICTVTQWNRKDCLQVVDIARSLGIKMVSYHYFSPIGLGGTRSEISLSPNEWMDFCKEVNALEQRDVWVYYPPTFCTPDELDKYVERGYKGCTARWLERLAIFPDGNVYLCSVFFDTNYNFATIDSDGLKLKTQKPSELDIVMRVPSGCKTCDMNKACRAGCNAYSELGNSFPKLFKNSECQKEIVPMCPLWSTTFLEAPPSNIQELR